jgi:hypothetical protein
VIDSVQFPAVMELLLKTRRIEVAETFPLFDDDGFDLFD